MSKVLGRDKEYNRIVAMDSMVLFPDSVFEDTSAVDEYALGDTLYTIRDGKDTLFVLYDDSLSNLGDTLRAYDITKDIKINLGGVTNTINPGQFGFAIEGMFRTGHMPQGDAYNPEAWDWMSALCPKTIRFPGGASDRFVHLLPYDRDGDDIEDDVKGYGYDIYEIIRFYDITDGVIDAIDPTYIESILLDMEADNECDDFADWMKSLTDGIDPVITFVYQKQFEDHYKKWEEEQLLDPDDPNVRYIDQFVHLINKIQTENEGHIVDVILDLNIMSETASQNKKIIEYLRNGALFGDGNHVTDINVVGVELGNEMYFDWAVLMMGFNTFNNYWDYINGADPNSGWTTSFYDYIFLGEMATDHDYIQKFKGDPLFECKIGLPADNLPYNSGFAFREVPAFKHTTDWNASLSHSSKYNATVTVGHNTRYKFDAIILHPYYEGDLNWEDLMLDNLFPKYPETLGVWHPCADTTEEWQYGSEDIRLRDAFWKLLGTSLLTPPGSFRDLIKQEYIKSYNEQNERFRFYLTTPNRKELWTTEWNMKDAHSSLDPVLEQPLVSSCTNSFPHGLLIQEWWLKNLKLNFNSNYKENFFTYSTFHNYGGGGANALTYHADHADFVEHEPELDPDLYLGQNHWLRRTTYFVMSMLSEINKNDLKYLASNFFMYASNTNAQPTVFIDTDEDYLYVYYSNLKDETQSYILNPNNLIDLYPEALALWFENATLTYIAVEQPYSNSGRSSLFTINTCYTNDNPHPFKIQGLTEIDIPNIPEVTSGMPVGAQCVTVPRLSMGYFKIPINLIVLKLTAAEIDKLITIYPNPAGDYFTVRSEMFGLISGNLTIDMYAISGSKIARKTVMENEPIDISDLPNGIYLVTIKDEKNVSVTKRLIKTN